MRDSYGLITSGMSMCKRLQAAPSASRHRLLKCVMDFALQRPCDDAVHCRGGVSIVKIEIGSGRRARCRVLTEKSSAGTLVCGICNAVLGRTLHHVVVVPAPVA